MHQFKSVSKIWFDIILFLFSRIGDEYPDGELILKTCIGGAFYNKYIKAQYKNGDMLSRMKTDEIFQTD